MHPLRPGLEEEDEEEGVEESKHIIRASYDCGLAKKTLIVFITLFIQKWVMIVPQSEAFSKKIPTPQLQCSEEQLLHVYTVPPLLIWMIKEVP